MLKKIQNFSLRKNIDKCLLVRDVSQRNTSLRYLGFLIDEALFDKFESLYEFGTDLGLQRKDIKQLTFAETRKRIPSLRNNQITNKEFNWRGEIHNEDAREFLDYPFDVLIGFYKGKHKYLDALVAESKAKFKIGFNDADKRLFDLLLTVDLQDAELMKAEVAKYLKILNKL